MSVSQVVSQTIRYQNGSLMYQSVVASVTATCQTRALEKWVITLESLQVFPTHVGRGIHKILRLLHDMYRSEVKNVWSLASNLRHTLIN